MVERAIIYRGRSDAACGLRGGTVDCARQRAAGTRLGIGTHVPHGGHQGGIERRGSASTATAEQTNCRRAKHADTFGGTARPAKYFCAGEPAGADNSPRESRRTDYCARPDAEPVRVIGGGGAGRHRSTGRDAGSAGALQRECLHGSLPIISGSRLYLSAERWAAQALFKISARLGAQPTFLFAARCRAVPGVPVCRIWHCLSSRGPRSVRSLGSEGVFRPSRASSPLQ